MAGTLKAAEEARLRLRRLRERIATARTRRPAWPALAPLEASCAETEGRVARLGRRAASIRISLLEDLVHSAIDDLDRRISLEDLLPVAVAQARAPFVRGHPELSRRFDFEIEAASRELRTERPAAWGERIASLGRLLEEAHTLERIEFELGAIQQRLERLRTRMPQRQPPGELTLVRRLAEQLGTDGLHWSPAVRETVLQRIARGVTWLESHETPAR